MRKLFLLTAMMLTCSLTILAQVTTSSINGKVVTNGEEVIGATITAKHLPSGTVYNAVTNVHGRYTIQGMRVGGPYDVTISYLGLRTEEFHNIQLALGEASTFNVDMKEDSQLLGEVVVTGQSSFSASGASSNFSLQQIENTPTVSRDIFDVAKLSPLVSSKNGGISIAGMSNRYNSFQIDGVVSNDVFGLNSTGQNGTGAGGNPISMDAVEQIQVVASPFDVRQSGFTGGAINAITKSGTNKLTGTAFYYYTDENLYGRYNQLQGQTEKLKNQEKKTYGFTIGGPIIKDKLFFFASLERSIKEYPATYYAGMDGYFMTTDLAQAIVDKYEAYTGIRESYARNDISTKNTSILGRLDWNISNKHKLTIRYQLNKSNDEEYSGGQYTYYFHNSCQNKKNTTQSIVAELNSTLGENMYNEFRVSGNFVRDPREVGYQAPSVYITGGGIYDPATGTETMVGSNLKLSMGPYYAAGINYINQDIWTIEDNFSWYAGNHTITAGTHNEFYRMKNAYYTYAFGQYNYTTFTDFFNDKPSQFTWNYSDQSITGTTEWAAPMNAGQLGFYLQDKWDVNTRFQATLGLRIDAPVYFNEPSWNHEFNLSSYAIENDVIVGRAPKTTLMFSPRFGFRYYMDDAHRYTLRGGVGIFNGRAPFVWLENAWANAGIEKKGTTIYSPNAPKFSDYGLDTPAAAASVAGKATKPDINTVDREFKFPQVVRANLAFEALLPGDVKMSLEGLFSKNLNSVWFENLAIKDKGDKVYAVQGMESSAVPYYSYDIAGYNSIVNLTNTNKGYSYSLSAKFEKSFDFGLDLMASYTHSHSYSVNDGLSSQAISNWQMYPRIDPNKKVLSYSIFDQPHRVMLQASFNSKRYFKGLMQSHVSLTYNGTSGHRYSLVMSEGSYSPTFNGDYTVKSTSNELIYIPTTLELQKMEFKTEQDRLLYDQWIEGDDYARTHRGQYAERNSHLTPWENQFDLHFTQDFFYLKNRGSKISLVFDIVNVANLLNRDWGTIHTSSYGYPILKVENVKTDDKGNRYGVFSFAGQHPQVTDISSRWHMQLGMRVTF